MIVVEPAQDGVLLLLLVQRDAAGEGDIVNIVADVPSQVPGDRESGLRSTNLGTVKGVMVAWLVLRGRAVSVTNNIAGPAISASNFQLLETGETGETR